MTPKPAYRHAFAVLAVTTLFAGCEGPLGPAIEQYRTIAKLRNVTAQYKDLDVAIAEGFVLLHECEVRPGEGAVGILYVHMDRFLDGELDPDAPDGLLYAPGGDGNPELTGVEVALPMSMWTEPGPPEFLGVPLQEEAEFGAWGLHIWVWRDNPDGMFAQAHPDVACGPEA